MAKTVVTTLTLSINGDSYSGNPVYSNATSNASGVVPTSVILASGFNSISVPSAAVGALVVPPPGSANSKTLKGVTGDTGIAMAPGVPFSLCFTAGAVSSFGITSGGAETIQVFWQ